MIMKNQLLNLKMIALMCLMMVLGGANVSAQETFNKTYSYGLSDWQLTNYEDNSSYYLVPKSGTESVATIHGIFQGKIINSDVVITINCATYGNGTNPQASTFTVFNSSDCGTAVKSTQSGQLPTSSTYTYVVYTIKSTDVSLLTKDLAIKITKPGKQIRLKSISVKFSFESNANSYSVAWNVNGKAYTEGTPTTKVYEGNKVTTLPTTPKDINGKIFVGWTNSEITAAQNDAPSVLFTDATDAPTVTGNVTYYAVFADSKYTGATEAKIAQTLEFDTWTYSGNTTEKKGYRLFGKDSYVESAEFDLSTLAKVVVYAGTFGNKKNTGLTIGDDTNIWKKVDIKGQSDITENVFEGGTPLSGNGKLRVISNVGDGINYGVRISKIEIFTNQPVATYYGYCTTVEAAAEPTYTPAKVNFVAHAGDDYYATFSNANVVFMPKDVTISAVTVDNNNVVMRKSTDNYLGTEGTVNIEGTDVAGYYIPAKTGVLLNSKNSGEVTYYTVENKEVAEYDAILNNMLMPSVAGGVFEATDGYKYYKLAYDNFGNETGLGFYWGAPEGGKFFVKAGTAYLAVPVSKAGAKGFAFNGEATGIEGVNANVENAKAIYNLNGQRVASMAKPGLYIVNGKKVVRK